MIYFNHAATTYPKPQCVLEAVARSLGDVPESQYRSVSCGEYKEDVIKLCRGNLARLFHIENRKGFFLQVVLLRH